MKNFITLAAVFFVSFSMVLSCEKKNKEIQETTEKYLKHIADGNYVEAWKMLDETTHEIIPREEFKKEAEHINSLSDFIKIEAIRANNEKTEAEVPLEFTGQKQSFNKLEDMKITLYLKKHNDKWKITLKEQIEELQERLAQERIKIPINQELLDNAEKYRDKIEVKNLRNGAIEFSDGNEQYMMDATVTNNSDKHFSYIGVLVKFLDEDEEETLFESTFFVIYTRQIQEIYPIAPGETRDVIIPGYHAGDIPGNWTGNLDWEVHAVKIATPEEMIKMEDLDVE